MEGTAEFNMEVFLLVVTMQSNPFKTTNALMSFMKSGLCKWNASESATTL